MLEILSLGFMQRAFLVALLISIIAPCIGIVIVLKRLSNIGDATSHSALAGVSFGLAFGVNPIVGAVIFAILAVFSIEGFRKAFGKYAELSTTVVMSAGVGLTALLSGFIKSSGANLNSFLFGSIVAVSDFELFLTISLCIVVFTASMLLYKELFFTAFDEEAAHLAGVPVKTINFIFMLLTAFTVSIASRTVGALMISSLLVLPVTCAMTFAQSYRRTLIYAIAFALFFTITGLLSAVFFDLKPSGTIVIVGVLTLLFLMLINRNRR